MPIQEVQTNLSSDLNSARDQKLTLKIHPVCRSDEIWE